MSKKVKPTAKVTDAPLPAAIKESAQQIWSVGVDAITRAQQQSNRVFEAIVREGEFLRDNLQKKTRGAAGASVSEVTARATDTWDKLEQVFEKRVARALATLGVPTRCELAALNEQVEALTRIVRHGRGGAAVSTVKKASAKARPVISTTATRRRTTKSST